MIQYQVFILPNTTRQYFKQIFSVLEHYKSNAVVITTYPEYLLSECCYCENRFICRIKEDGKVISNAEIIQQVLEMNPRMLILDDCFWDNQDTHLLNSLFDLQKNHNQQMSIINVIQHGFPSSWKSLKTAQRIRFPSSLLHTKFIQSNDLSMVLYDNDETLIPRSNTVLTVSPSSPKVYKQAFSFYQLLHKIKCLTEFDIFCMFLRQLNEFRSGKILTHLFVETRKYSFYGVVLQNKELGPMFISDYITVINHIILLLIQDDEPLFLEIYDFFVNNGK